MTATIDQLAELIARQANEQYLKDFPNTAETIVVQVHTARLYTRVDVGPAHNISGKYVVEHSTGNIYGIKGYGQVHRGHPYGTLDTINDWYWGGYVARKLVAS